MIAKNSLTALIFLMAIIAIVPLNVMAEVNDSCQMQFVYRSSEGSMNKLVLQNYQDDEWTAPMLVHSTASGFSYAPTTASDAEGNSIFVWVEDNGSTNQLMYRVKSRLGKWSDKPQPLTKTKGEKTTPVLIRSISGTIYLSWVSDENDFDDVFLSSWSVVDGWSEAQLLSFDNAFPDIRPSFEYIEDINGKYELFVSWQARSNDGVYAPDQHVLEADLELSRSLKTLSEGCSIELSKVGLPISTGSGFLHLPQINLESYQQINRR